MRALVLRALLSLLAVAALVGVSLLRLARIERPNVQRVTQVAAGVVVVERVTVGRRVLGHTVRCAGRVVWERLGAQAPTIVEGLDRVQLRHRGCRLELRLPGCDEKPPLRCTSP